MPAAPPAGELRLYLRQLPEDRGTDGPAGAGTGRQSVAVQKPAGALCGGVSGCTIQNCLCKFEHQKDRRVSFEACRSFLKPYCRKLTAARSERKRLAGWLPCPCREQPLQPPPMAASPCPQYRMSVPVPQCGGGGGRIKPPKPFHRLFCTALKSGSKWIAQRAKRHMPDQIGQSGTSTSIKIH